VNPDAVTSEVWDAMCAEEQDALIASGWHPAPPRPRPDGTDGREHVIRRIKRQLMDTPAYVTITASEARDLLSLVEGRPKRGGFGG